MRPPRGLGTRFVCRVSFLGGIIDGEDLSLSWIGNGWVKIEIGVGVGRSLNVVVVVRKRVVADKIVWMAGFVAAVVGGCTGSEWVLSLGVKGVKDR